MFRKQSVLFLLLACLLSIELQALFYLLTRMWLNNCCCKPLILLRAWLKFVWQIESPCPQFKFCLVPNTTCAALIASLLIIELFCSQELMCLLNNCMLTYFITKNEHDCLTCGKKPCPQFKSYLVCFENKVCCSHIFTCSLKQLQALFITWFNKQVSQRKQHLRWARWNEWEVSKQISLGALVALESFAG